MRRAWILLVATCLLSMGCATNPSIPIIEQVPIPQLTALPPGVPSRILILDRVIIEIPKGTVVGEQRRGNLCLFPEELKWGAETLTFREGAYHKEFAQVVTAANFRRPGKPMSLFEFPTLSGIELFVAARVSSVKENVCSAIDAFGSGRGIYKGNVRLGVHWEVYSVADQKVVLALDNECSTIGDGFRPLGEHNLYVRAFGNALRGLLTNEEFRKLATSIPAPKLGT